MCIELCLSHLKRALRALEIQYSFFRRQVFEDSRLVFDSHRRSCNWNHRLNFERRRRDLRADLHPVFLPFSITADVDVSHETRDLLQGFFGSFVSTDSGSGLNKRRGAKKHTYISSLVSTTFWTSAIINVKG